MLLCKVYLNPLPVNYSLLFGLLRLHSLLLAGEYVLEELLERVELCLICQTNSVSLRVVEIVCV